MRVTVVGGGAMGHGIAQVAAVSGADVAVFDPAAEVLTAVPDRIAGNLDELGLDRAVLERVRLCDTLEQAVADADWVFEAVPENLELKRQVFARMDDAAPPHAVLATNTSVISVDEIAQGAERRERVIGTHWWNPPYLVPLVEVVEGRQTAGHIVESTMDLLRQFGKLPVHVKRDVPGFVGNRLQHALWREAFSLIEQGVCDAETVDTVVKAGFGIRLAVLGPVENADLVGLDLTLAIHEYLLPRLDPPSQPSTLLRQRIAEGRLGMATGEGLRTWGEGEPEAVRVRLRDHLVRGTDG